MGVLHFLHYQTLALVLGLVSLFSVLVFWGLWRINREIAGLMYWFWSALLAGTGWVVVYVHYALGLDSLGVAVNHATALVGLVLNLEGVLRFQGIGGRSRARRPWLVAMCIIGIVLAILNRDDSVRRYYLHDLLGAALCVAIAVALIWRTGGRSLAIQGAAAVGYILLALVLARRWHLASEALPGTDLTRHPWMSVVFLTAVAQAVAWAEAMNLAVNQRVQQRLHRMAMYDELTQLPNRRGFATSVQFAAARARRAGGCFGLALIDLDDFKSVNDRYGHESGDAMLQTVARRLEAALRGGDVVSRLGGDEFVVVLEDCPDATSLSQAIARMQSALKAPLECKDPQGRIVTLRPHASIGGALFPVDAQSVDGLLQVADRRMYDHKPSLAQAQAGDSS